MTSSATVLIADDIAANRNFLSDLLSAQGYRVFCADGGREALRLICEHHPDLVLLDVIMPDLDGHEVCRQARAQFDRGLLPIIMVTALDDTQDKIRGLEAGADDFLSKPINQAELLARVRSLLRIKSLYDTVNTQAKELAQLNAQLEVRVAQQVAQMQRLEQLKRFFPAHLAQRIVEGDVDDPLQTRRREVTVVFITLQKFASFTDTSEPEEVMALLRELRTKMGALIDRHQGTLEQFAGEHMMVVFNDPLLIDDPAGRAVALAIDLRDMAQPRFHALRQLGHDLSLGIGIAHGHATIGNVGHDHHLTYGVVGRVTNLASHLSRIAEEGEILISAPARQQSARDLTTSEAHHIELEGFLRPVVVYRVEGLQPAVPLARHWPVRIYTLGQFSVRRDGDALAFKRKTQKKPLDLLRLLIAMGGTRVETNALIAELWPESDGDAAKITFDSTLYRLRKLLEVDACLLLSEGKLSVNKDLCWIDTWALDELVTSIEQETSDAPSHAMQLLQLYAGPFLGTESSEAPVLTLRDRMQARFLRAVTVLGNRLEAEARWDLAADLYSRALEVDSLAENLYRRLMIVYREQGEIVAAIGAYRRCRDLLSLVLGRKPSPETVAVMATLTPGHSL